MKLQGLKKLGFVTLCTSLLLLSIPQGTFAKTTSEIKSEQKKVAAKKEALLADMEKLDNEMSDIQEKLRNNNNNIKEANKEITILKNDIKETEDRMAKREEIIANRLRTIQQTGGLSNYLQVLFGAESFSDFLRKLGSVNTILDADHSILEEHKNDKHKLDEAKKKLDETLTSLKNTKTELENDKKVLEAKTKSKEKVLKKLKVQENQLELELSEKEKEKIMNSQSSTSGTNGGTYPAVSESLFSRPAVGPVTSEFAARWGSFHYGIDIGKRGASVPIVAAAEGKVIQSYYSSSYGNVVFIEHHLNGRLYTTVYAHMERRDVSAGQTVSKGQHIGYMGNTGQSFGAHLHFEIHEGNWNGSKSNAVNPRKYVNF